MGLAVKQTEKSTIPRAEELETALLNHFELYHSCGEKYLPEIEAEILNNEMTHLEQPGKLPFKKGIVAFRPSSASKCERELFYQFTHAEKDEQPMAPYQRRWVRNASVVHTAVQQDLLYAEKVLQTPLFHVARVRGGRPAWEQNIKHVKQFEHQAIRFQLVGMMDGILRYKDGSFLGFEFKTKSTTIGEVADVKLRGIQQEHKAQAIAYSLLFGIEEFLFLYESLAKDKWIKGAEAKQDLRAFYFKPSDQEKGKLLDKFRRVVVMVESKALPAPELDKCVFCPFKTQCQQDGLSM